MPPTFFGLWFRAAFSTVCGTEFCGQNVWNSAQFFLLESHSAFRYMEGFEHSRRQEMCLINISKLYLSKASGFHSAPWTNPIQWVVRGTHPEEYEWNNHRGVTPSFPSFLQGRAHTLIRLLSPQNRSETLLLVALLPLSSRSSEDLWPAPKI